MPEPEARNQQEQETAKDARKPGARNRWRNRNGSQEPARPVEHNHLVVPHLDQPDDPNNLVTPLHHI